MQKWEYLVITPGRDVREWTEKLNRAGSNGWELVVMVGDPAVNSMPAFVMKRPVAVPGVMEVSA